MFDWSDHVYYTIVSHGQTDAYFYFFSDALNYIKEHKKQVFVKVQKVRPKWKL